MKTIININNHLRLCEERLSPLLSWFRQLLEHGDSMLAKMKSLGRKEKPLQVLLHHVRVGLGHLVILAKSIVLAATVNSRVYVGILLVGAAYPLCSCSHLFFSREVVNKNWYYEHYADLFLVIGPYLSVFFCMLGAYFMQPMKDDRGRTNYRAMALFIPMGLALGKVLWLLQVQSNDEFWNLPPIGFVFYGLLLGSLLPTVIDWTIWRKFHDFDAKMARPIGLASVIPMSESDRNLLKSEIEKAKNFKF